MAGPRRHDLRHLSTGGIRHDGRWVGPIPIRVDGPVEEDCRSMAGILFWGVLCATAFAAGLICLIFT